MGSSNCSRPLNSRVKKTCVSLGSDAMAFRSSIGAQATPTVNTVIPVTGQGLEVRIAILGHFYHLPSMVTMFVLENIISAENGGVNLTLSKFKQHDFGSGLITHLAFEQL